MLNAVRDFSKCVYAGLCVGDAIDFCVWVLEYDGLRVPPFDKHLDGDSSLRARGMTADSWLNWIQRTALLLDQRLAWQIDPIARREWAIEQYEQMSDRAATQNPNAFFPQFDRVQMTEQLDRQYAWQVTQCEKLRAIVAQVYGDVPPPNVLEDDIAAWDGHPAVAERLYELYEYYPFRERERLWLDFGINADGSITGPVELIVNPTTAFDLVQSRLAEYDGAEIYLVSYPYPTEFAMLPGTLVLSPSQEPRNQQIFDDRVSRAINQLVLLHNA